jgi:hypothetical protein
MQRAVVLIRTSQVAVRLLFGGNSIMSDEPFDQDQSLVPTPTKRTPYDVIQAAIAAGIKPTVQDSWPNFAYWETARNFADDPSHPAKAAIEWVFAMDNLRGALDEFTGEAKAECLTALDRAYVAFAKLEHSDELVDAMEKWIEYRLSE